MKKIFLLFLGLNLVSYSQKINYDLYEGEKFKAITNTNNYENCLHHFDNIEPLILHDDNTEEELIKNFIFNEENDKQYNGLIKSSLKLDYLLINYEDVYVRYIDSKNVVNVICYSKNNRNKIIGRVNYNYIIRNLGIDLFWQFYNSDDDNDFPKINKLKPLVKDTNGVLNIDKLAKVIKDNKSLLSEYLDN